MATTTGIFELLAGSSSPLLASGDVVCFVDISDSTQAPQGSLVKSTLTAFFAAVPVPVVVTSASANALAVGLAGASNSAFLVDCSTALQVAGLKVTGAVTGGTVAVVVTDSGLNASLTVNAKGSGTIGIGSVSTGRVTITPATTITGALTQTGLATFNGGATVASGQTLTVSGATITGLTAASVGAGTFPAGAFVFAGAVSGITTLAGTGAVSGFTTGTFSSTFLVSGGGAAATPTSTFNGLRLSGGDTGNTIYNGARAIAITADSGTSIHLATTSLGGTVGLSVSTTNGNVNVWNGFTVSGTTAVQALTATNASITHTADPGLTITSDASLANRHIRFTNSQASGKSWDIEQDNVGNGSGIRFKNQTDAVSALILSPTGAGTFAAGISCTTGTFSTSMKTASGATSVNSGAATTLFAVPGAGSYVVTVYDNAAPGINYFQGTVTSDGAAAKSAIAGGSGDTTNISAFAASGLNIQLTQTTGATKTFNWSYIRILA